MESFDVVVIGGSTAGAPTAMLLARRGHKVLLIDKREFPRDTLSTHFIWARGVSYLNRWGLAKTVLDQTPGFRDLQLNVEGICLNGSVPLRDLEDRFQELHGNAEGVTDICCGPRRYLLDQILLNAAKDAGVEVREGVTFTHPIMKADAVVGIHAVSQKGPEIHAKAKVVIAADGRFSRFARMIGAKTRVRRELSTFAYWGYFQGAKNVTQAIHKRGRLGTAVFPTSDGTHMALAYGPRAWWDDFRRDPEENYFKLFDFCSAEVGAALRAAKRDQPFKACGSMPAFQREIVGPGWVLIGDAGGFHDQVTAMGQTHAFRDAELVAQFIQKGLSGEMTLAQALTAYERARAADYDAYFEFSCRMAEMNAYSTPEIGYFYSIRTDQSQVNQLISQLGDTLPFTQGTQFSGAPDAGLPAVLGAFESRLGGYGYNIFQSDVAEHQADRLAEAV